MYHQTKSIKAADPGGLPRAKYAAVPKVDTQVEVSAHG